jgi:recombination protein RecR
MKFSSRLLEQAVEALSGLPTIGKKTALRLALYLLKQDQEKVKTLANALIAMAEKVKKCTYCFNLSDDSICQICADESRDRQILCVVESIRDVMAIEETGQYNGRYHVLGGIISPIDGIGPEQLTIDALQERVQKESIQELIMAVSPTIEGETTIFYISRQLEPFGVSISTIARGVSFGGELEYADELTLGRSIVARLPYKANL